MDGNRHFMLGLVVDLCIYLFINTVQFQAEDTKAGVFESNLAGSLNTVDTVHAIYAS
jgi:hypothetical protein